MDFYSNGYILFVLILFRIGIDVLPFSLIPGKILASLFLCAFKSFELNNFIFPEVGLANPNISLIAVVLPAPFLPINP